MAECGIILHFEAASIITKCQKVFGRRACANGALAALNSVRLIHSDIEFISGLLGTVGIC